jgi:methylenetetrahydrofolate reductase (NADPH)
MFILIFLGEEINVICALTWGCFPNREIIQPTIYDSEVFYVWKKQAFNSWDDWIRIYQQDDICEESANILNKIKEEYYLVTVFDNDYVNPKIENLFGEFFSDISL